MSQVEYILGLFQPPSGHSVGVQSISATREHVVTGGRDGRICGWVTGAAKPVFQYDAHTNWVNGVLAVGSSIWSCSADTTVKIWNDGELTTAGAHRDYAWCLAQCGSAVLSGGFDGNIIGWSPDGAKQFESHVDGVLGSIYSLAGYENNYVSGGPDSLVRMWDTRLKQQVNVFTGHNDNVRALLMNDSYILSGSSDCTVKLWDLRAGRLFKTFTNHTDSVFSLHSNNNLESWMSGDRSGKVFATNKETLEPTLVCDQGTAVRNITEFDGLWTAAKSIRHWPQSTLEMVEIEPSDSLVKSQLLNDKRRVLIASSNGEAAMVDILQGKVLEQLPHIDPTKASEELAALAEKVNTQDVLDNWCQVGIRAGKLVISLEERSAGTTEVYADTFSDALGIDFGECDDERRVNVGKWALQAIFAKFAAAQLSGLEAARTAHRDHKAAEAKEQKQEAEKAAAAQQTREKSRFRSMFGLRKSKDEELRSGSPAPPSQKEKSPDKHEKRETYKDAYQAAVELDLALAEAPPFEFPDNTRVLVSSVEPGAGAATVVFDCMVAQLGNPACVTELENSLPAFVGEALWLPKMSSRQPMRIGFNVVPFDDSYPEIVQNKSRLLANPVLRARKVMSYVVTSLKETGHLKNEDDIDPDQLVELYCKDELLSPLMTLAFIRTRIWRSGGDVLLNYKLKQQPVH